MGAISDAVVQAARTVSQLGRHRATRPPGCAGGEHDADISADQPFGRTDVEIRRKREEASGEQGDSVGEPVFAADACASSRSTNLGLPRNGGSAPAVRAGRPWSCESDHPTLKYRGSVVSKWETRGLSENPKAPRARRAPGNWGRETRRVPASGVADRLVVGSSERHVAQRT